MLSKPELLQFLPERRTCGKKAEFKIISNSEMYGKH